MPGMPLKLRKRAAVFFIMMIGMLLVLTGRIGWIQFVEGQKLTARINDQLRENRTIYSLRGTIYDRNGRELAVSTMTKSLYANPEQIKDPEIIARQMSPILNISQENLKKMLTEKGTFVWIKRMLEPDQYNEIISLIKENDIRGLNFIEESKRYYPNGFMLSQVLGFVGTDDIGLEGLEAYLDKTIRGQFREQFINTDNQGVPILESIFAYMPRKEKISVCLTVDSVIQYIVEKALDNAVARTNARAAIAIVTNPKTGEILAMANRPTYDPNFFYRYQAAFWKNNSVSMLYEPGSTFKAVIAAAALEEGIINPESMFNDKGHIKVSGSTIKNWNDKSYGRISFLDIMKYSINTGFVEIGLQMGALKLNDYAKKFGFGQLTGIELYGEEEGLLFDPDEMRDVDIATMSIGQSIAVTPIQLVSAFGAIANDGVLTKPHIIKEYRTSDGKIIDKSAEHSPPSQIILPETARTLTRMMVKVVEEGGAMRAFVPGYHFAGKTGTAEKIKESGYGYQSGRYIASFAGFGPIEDPKFAAIVILDDPDGAYYGGEIAAPVFSEIMSQIMRYENISPQENKKNLESIQSFFAVEKEETKNNKAPDQDLPLMPPKNGRTQVPNLDGKTIRTAGEILKNQDLKFIPHGTGVAVRQSIMPYEAVDVQTEIIVYFEPK